MSLRTFGVLIVCLISGFVSAESSAEARRDAHGFPLPEGAVARLGDLHFAQRGRIDGIVVSPDGKVVATAGAPHVWKSAAELRSELEALGITPDKHIVPYCSTGVRSAALYFTLRLIGYDDVSLFSGSYQEWTADPSRPVEK